LNTRKNPWYSLHLRGTKALEREKPRELEETVSSLKRKSGRIRFQLEEVVVGKRMLTTALKHHRGFFSGAADVVDLGGNKKEPSEGKKKNRCLTRNTEGETVESPFRYRSHLPGTWS